uniref:Ovule protein n=1 Tax=Syphacia muris TaxID=451379 RepID=A0A158R4Z8_9BILA
MWGPGDKDSSNWLVVNKKPTTSSTNFDSRHRQSLRTQWTSYIPFNQRNKTSHERSKSKKDFSVTLDRSSLKSSFSKIVGQQQFEEPKASSGSTCSTLNVSDVAESEFKPVVFTNRKRWIVTTDLKGRS